MRSLLLAGVAAISFAATPALAGPFWFLGNAIDECYEEGVQDLDSPQVECASNSIDDDGYSNDGNVQYISQDQFGIIFDTPEDTLQLQIGRNYVEEGDDNTQVIHQSQGLIGDPEDDEVQQLQVGVNSVEDGDNNFQKIEQSQTLVVID